VRNQTGCATLLEVALLEPNVLQPSTLYVTQLHSSRLGTVEVPFDVCMVRTICSDEAVVLSLWGHDMERNEQLSLPISHLRAMRLIHIDKNVVVYIDLRYRVVVDTGVWLLYFKMLMTKTQYSFLE
jgi:hypothetical protein